MINSDKPHDYWQLFVHELYPNGHIGKKISKFVATVMNEDGQAMQKLLMGKNTF